MSEKLKKVDTKFLDMETENKKPTHIIKARAPEGVVNPNHFREITDPGKFADVLTDAANFPGGRTDRVVKFSPGTLEADGVSEADVAHNLKKCAAEQKTVIVRAGGTSLTGAVIPRGDVVFDFSSFSRIQEPEKIRKNGIDMDVISVQPGATFEGLQQKLSGSGLFFPAAPTYDLAQIGGGFNTNAGGARGYKYGQMRRWIEGAKIMLSSGEMLDISRGQYLARSGDEISPYGYFELERTDGTKNRIPVPSYKTPGDIPKVSAGIYSAHGEQGKPGMDLLDLFIGSEGTLGIVTEIKLKVIKEPDTLLALVPCDDDDKALGLAAELRIQEIEKRKTLEPGGISAVEIIGQNAVGLLRSKNKIQLPDDRTLLLVQVEMPGGDEASLISFNESCEQAGVDTESINIVMPNDSLSKKKEFIAIREAAPNTINELISKHKKSEPGITKVGSDGCVEPEKLPLALGIYKKLLEKTGLEWYFWGHGEGNLHINVIPHSLEQLLQAKQIIEQCGTELISVLGGVGTSEHGVGKNESKQKLTGILLGENAFDQMQAVMDSLDPERILAIGNLRKKSKGTIFHRK